jgi:hypothetical protein
MDVPHIRVLAQGVPAPNLLAQGVLRDGLVLVGTMPRLTARDVSVN